ncbi:uncharacterized protein LOC109546748 [Dendroctonus ponderosae]
MSPKKRTNSTLDNTRKVARVVFTTIKKIGSRGATLKNIYNYIKKEYPHSLSNMIKLNNTLKKALAFGAVNKKMGNRYVLGNVIKALDKPSRQNRGITEARRRKRKRAQSSKRRKARRPKRR